jgi:hypothetical protein
MMLPTMLRRLFNLLSAVSLLLCVATVWLWCGATLTAAGFRFPTAAHDPAAVDASPLSRRQASRPPAWLGGPRST